jgi:serine/threonine protein kinase
MSENLIGKIFFNKYKLIRKLGEGSFGSIYQGKSEDEYYALKLEKRSNETNLLENEAYIMSYLKGRKNIK